MIRDKCSLTRWMVFSMMTKAILAIKGESHVDVELTWLANGYLGRIG